MPSTNDFLSGHTLVILASRKKEKSTYSEIFKNFCVEAGENSVT